MGDKVVPLLLVEVPFQATGLFSSILAIRVLGLTRRLFVFLLVCSSLGSVTCDGVVASTGSLAVVEGFQEHPRLSLNIIIPSLMRSWPWLE
jgi:hypothetical protein